MLPEKSAPDDAAPPARETAATRPFSGTRVLAGVVLSWMGALISFSLLRKDAGVFSRICSVGTGCDAVLTSRYSVILGVPLPWFGIALYLVVFSLLLVVLSAPGKAVRVAVWNLALWLCVVGITFSAALMYVQFILLRAFCPLCTASAVIMAALVAVLASEESVHGHPAAGLRSAALALAGMAAFSCMVLFPSGHGSSGDLVAVVDGQKFTRAQMEEDLAIARQSQERERYALESEWVRGKVDGALLAGEAQRLGTSPDKLLADRMGGEPAVSVAEIDALLTRTGRPPTTENAAAARQELQAEWRNGRRTTVLSEIAANHQVQIFLPPPTLQKMEIDLSTAQLSGPANAAVQLVVFSDFQCQFCAQLAPVLQRIRAEFADRVLVAFRYFPLETHPRAFPAAIAAECAAEQGAFWDYHDRLFAEGGDLSESRLTALAAKSGLDSERFQQCLRSDRARKAVEWSQRNAAESGLEGAPAVFLNGTRINGKLDYDQLAGLIKTELKAHPETAPPTPRASP